MPGNLNLKEESEFIQACEAGNISQLSALFEKDPKLVNTPASNGSYPLMIAILAGKLGVVSWLVLKGARVGIVADNEDNYGLTALWHVAAWAQWDIVRLMLKAGAKNCDCKPLDGPNKDKSLLYLAALDGEDEIVMILLGIGATIDIIPKSPLQLIVDAIVQPENDIQKGKFKAYLNAGKILKAAEDLFTHAENKTGSVLELTKILNILGSALNGFKNTKTALKIALENKHDTLVELLIARGANRLDSAGNLLYQFGEMTLALDADDSFISSSMRVFSKLNFVKSLLEDGALVQDPLLMAQNLKKIELATRGTLYAALELEEPLRSEILSELNFLLCQALPFTRPLLSLIEETLQGVRLGFYSTQNYKKACSLYVQAHLSQAPDNADLASEANERQHKKALLRYIFESQDLADPYLISSFSLNFILGEGHTINPTLAINSNGISAGNILVEVFSIIKRIFSNIRTRIPTSTLHLSEPIIDSSPRSLTPQVISPSISPSMYQIAMLTSNQPQISNSLKPTASFIRESTFSDFSLKEESEFIQNCFKGDIQKLEKLLAVNPRLVNTPASIGLYPIHIMLTAGSASVEKIKWMITKGAEVDAKVKNGCYKGISTVWWAVNYKQWDIVQELLQNHLIEDPDASPEAGPSKGIPVLLRAARSKQWDIVEALLRQGAKKLDITRENGSSNGKTALWYTFHYKQWDLMRALLRAGAKNIEYACEDRPNKGKTILWRVAAKQEWDLVGNLLSLEIKNIDASPFSGSRKGTTALWLAAIHQRWDMVDALLQAGAKNVDACPESGPRKGETVLWLAVANRQWEIMQRLLHLGSKNLDTAPEEGRDKDKTVLWLAAIYKEWDILLMLLKAGAKKINKAPENDPSVSLLYCAVLAGEDGIVQVLLEGGAAIDLNPMSALCIAIRQMILAGNHDKLDKYFNVVTILKAAEDLFNHAKSKTGSMDELNRILDTLGPALNACKDKKTALKVAIENQHPILIDLLMARGANCLDIQGNLLLQNGGINLMINKKQVQRMTPSIKVFSLLRFLQILLEDCVTPNLFAAEDSLWLLRKIEGISNETFNLALNLNEPIRSQVFFQLCTMLSQALPFTQSLMPLIKSALQHVHPHSHEYYKKACALFVELSLGHANFDMIDYKPLHSTAEPSLGKEKDQPKKERLRRAIEAEDALDAALLPMLALEYSLGEEYSINTINTRIAENASMAIVLTEIFEEIREEFDKYRGGMPASCSNKSSVFTSAIGSSSSSSLHFMHTSSSASGSSLSTMSASCSSIASLSCNCLGTVIPAKAGIQSNTVQFSLT